jgi:membrane protein
MIRLQNATAGRFGRYDEKIASAVVPGAKPAITALTLDDRGRPWWTMILRLPRWMYRGYNEANASDLAAAVAFNTLVALVPMFLLVVAMAGLFLKNDQVLSQATIVIDRLVPGGETADEAFTTALTARNNSGWLGLISFFGFAWVGTGFVSCLARSMNRIYGARSSGYINEKQRGFLILFLFSLLFIVSLAATVVTTFFVNQELPDVFQPWVLATVEYQVIGYIVGFMAAFVLFFTLYRIIPNAGQRAGDVWPGTVTASVLFVILTQLFPIYIRTIGGGNTFGQVFGFVSLLVASLFMMAHVILFGAYTNATWQRRRRLRERQRRLARAAEMGTGPLDDIELDLRSPA